MIVRDEAKNLPTRLASRVGLVDEVLVVDTGSTDCTPDSAEPGGDGVSLPWEDDFSSARNAGITQAVSEWILVPDRGERIHSDDKGILVAALQRR